MLQQLRQVGVQQRLAAGEQQGIHIVVRQVIDDAVALLQAQLAGVDLCVGVRVAMHAAQVAGAGDIPHDDGFARAGGGGGAGSGAGMSGSRTMAQAVADVVCGLLGTAPEASYVNHWRRMRRCISENLLFPQSGGYVAAQRLGGHHIPEAAVGTRT